MPAKRTPRLTLEDIFARSELIDQCIVYPKTRYDGYGYIYVGNQKTVVAHRHVFQAVIGEIEDEVLDHLCRNRACINVEHLEPTSIGENVLRGEGILARNARKTHCKWGHEFTPENTYLWGGFGRYCLTCRRQRALKRHYALDK